MLQARTVKPFTRSAAAPKVQLARRAQLQVRRAAEPDAALEAAAQAEWESNEDDFGPRGRKTSSVEKGMELKHFLPLPKPAHLVYVKPTVAVVAGVASRASVGLKMTAGDQGLERYVIEYYARSVK